MLPVNNNLHFPICKIGDFHIPEKYTLNMSQEQLGQPADTEQ